MTLKQCHLQNLKYGLMFHLIQRNSEQPEIIKQKIRYWKLDTDHVGFAKPTLKDLQNQPSSVFYENLHALKIYKFIKKRLQHRCFPVNIAKFLRTPILKNICEQLLLDLDKANSIFFWFCFEETRTTNHNLFLYQRDCFVFLFVCSFVCLLCWMYPLKF